MHASTREGLEGFLKDDCGPEFASHLDACPECRDLVKRMREQALDLRVLRAGPEAAPAPGFYARVMARIETQRRPSLWSLLLEPAFGRRLMYASLTLVVLLGTYLVATESGEPVTASTSAERYLAEEHPTVGANPQQDRDVVLVRLATYGE